MKTRLIYLQSGFWNKVREDSSVEGQRTLLELYDIFSESDICSDMNIEEWKNDELLMFILKKYVSGGNIELEFDSKDKIENVLNSTEENIEELSAVYMLNESKMKCDGYGIQKGILAITPDNLPRRKDLFKGQSFSVDKGVNYERTYLSFRDKLKHFCNSMIIIDPYILSKPKLLQENLIPLLKSILPENLKIPFHLSIFSKIADNKPIDEMYSQIEEELKKIRQNLDIELSIHKIIGTDNEFHSRHIITNNALIDSEDGFNLFNYIKESTKNATITKVYPRFLGDDRGDMSKYLKWISIAKKRALSKKEIIGGAKWGDGNNRLFDMIEDTNNNSSNKPTEIKKSSVQHQETTKPCSNNIASNSKTKDSKTEYIYLKNIGRKISGNRTKTIKFRTRTRRK